MEKTADNLWRDLVDCLYDYKDTYFSKDELVEKLDKEKGIETKDIDLLIKLLEVKDVISKVDDTRYQFHLEDILKQSLKNN